MGRGAKRVVGAEGEIEEEAEEASTAGVRDTLSTTGEVGLTKSGLKAPPEETDPSPTETADTNEGRGAEEGTKAVDRP